ncbi:MAG TPA: choice-of-anchor Q domain-containing protein [Polyangiaceae bacterium]
MSSTAIARTRHRVLVRTGFILVFLAALLTACGPPATVKVIQTADGNDGSLRAAIASVNQSAGATTRIEIPAGTYDLSRCGSDDTNAGGDLDLTTNAPITIAGTGGAVTIRQTCPGERVLDAHGAGVLTLTGVTITGGSLSGTTTQPARGGGVRAAADVQLQNAKIESNTATGAAGVAAVAGETAVDGGAAHGGGLYTAGSLTAISSSITLNTARGGTGATPSPPDAVASSGGAAEGGGAYVLGAIRIDGGLIGQNAAYGGDGGTSVVVKGGGGSVRGGGIAQAATSTAAVHLTGVTLSTNIAEGGASAHGGDDFPAGDASGGGVAAGGPVTAENVTAANNAALGGGGGRVHCPPGTANCNSHALSGSARGGALAGAGVTTITTSTFTDNQAASGANYFDVPGAEGGAVWAGGELRLTDATLSRNSARAQPSIFLLIWTGPSKGGAAASTARIVATGGECSDNKVLLGEGGALNAPVVNLRDTMFSRNESLGAGGAVSATTLTADGITASNNKAGGRGGGALAVLGDATITSSRVLANRVSGGPNSAAGGGILVAGQLTISRSEVSDNTGSAAVDGGRNLGMLPGVFRGGGIHAASVDAESVALANNSSRGISASAPQWTLGVTGGGAIAATGTVKVVNGTLSGNSAGAHTPGAFPSVTIIANQGAAILAEALELDHGTLADNTDGSTLRVGRLTTRGSAVAAPAGQLVCGGAVTVVTAQHNWFTDASCGLPPLTNQQTSADLTLGPLADNGGGVLTRAPAFTSVLVDSIPAAACTLRVDARGIARPQGEGCDLGAVELQTAGLGATDLALSFVEPPTSVTAGLEGTWRIRVANRGPNPTLPTLRIDVPEGVTLTSATTTSTAQCSTTDPALCVWTAPLAVGATAEITLRGKTNPNVTQSLVWRAQVSAPALDPPLEDDAVELSTAVTRQSTLSAKVVFDRTSGPSAVVELYSSGPSSVIGTDAHPISVTFEEAPGVHATDPWQTTTVGTFAPSPSFFRTFDFQISVDGTVPAQLGTVVIRADFDGQPPITLPVYAADIEIRADRSSAAQPSDTPTQFRVYATNRGPGPAGNISIPVSCWPDTGPFPDVSWSTSAGTFTIDSFGSSRGDWNIPALAAGQTAVLTGIASVAEGVTTMVAWRQVVWLNPPSGVDLDASNEEVTLDISPAPNGTADLKIENVQVVRGTDPYEQTVTVTVMNAGPAAVSSAWLQMRDAPIPQISPRSASWTCAYEGWTMTTMICRTSAGIEVGERLTFTFSFQSAVYYGHVIELQSYEKPDYDPSNNVRALNIVNF